MAKNYANVVQQLGTRICESVGIDANLVTRLVLDLNTRDGAWLQITAVCPSEVGSELADMVSRYKIVPADEEEGDG